MPRTLPPDSGGESEEDGEAFEGYEPEYSPEADDPGVFWCPRCGSEMYGDATLCPKCNEFVTPGARPTTKTPFWIWVGVVLVGLLLLGGLLAGVLHA